MAWKLQLPEPARRMKALTGAWLSPLQTIPNEFGSFLVWAVAALGIAGAGVWLVPLMKPEMSASEAYLRAIFDGALGTFCIALLGEAVTTNLIQAYPRRPWEDVEGGRAFAAVVGLFLLIAQTMVLRNLGSPDYGHKYIATQIWLAIGVGAVAIYLHCFRLAQEASVTKRLKTEDDDIQRMRSQAQGRDRTSFEEKL